MKLSAHKGKGYSMNSYYLTIAISAYLYGAIPFGFIFTWLFTGKKVYDYSTRTIGVANTFTVGGKKAGYLTVAGEASKGLLPVFIVGSLFQIPGPVLMAVFFALLGTSFPVFLPGKYGKGRTLIGWTTLFISPYTALTIAVIWICTAVAFKKASIAFQISSLCYPFFLYLFGGRISYLIFGVSVIIVFFIRSGRHNDDFKKNKIFDRWRKSSGNAKEKTEG